MKKLFKTIMITLIMMQVTTLTAFAEDTFSNWTDIENNMYKHFTNRDAHFDFIYTGTVRDFQDNIQQAIKDAYSKDDYLERSWVQFNPKGKVINNNEIEATIDATYLTTKQQEEYVDSELMKDTKNIISDDMSDFEKVNAINEYIINRYEYDYSLQSQSAYSAITTSQAICQGYSMTAYKMFNDAGIENRIIVGSVKNTSHSWNRVKVNGQWYNLDITNNDSTTKNKYFLVGDDFLAANGYTWDSSKYPAAPRKYNQ